METFLRYIIKRHMNIHKNLRSNSRKIIDWIGRWFRIFKILKSAYDFDYSSLYILEKYQLRNIANHLSKHNLYEGVEHDVAKIRLAMKLIDIMSDDFAYLEYIGNKPHFTKTVNMNNWQRFFRYNPERKAISRLMSNDETIELAKSMIYVEKASYLYYKIRENYTRQWWD